MVAKWKTDFKLAVYNNWDTKDQKHYPHRIQDLLAHLSIEVIEKTFGYFYNHSPLILGNAMSEITKIRPGRYQLLNSSDRCDHDENSHHDKNSYHLIYSCHEIPGLSEL